VARNLCTSRCVKCGYLVRLADVRGKSLEIRRYYQGAPAFGVRFDCPGVDGPCGEVYFVILRHKDTYWGRESLDSGEWKEKEIRGPNGQTYPNPNAGRFAYEDEGVQRPDGTWLIKPSVQETGCFVLDLSYYDSYNDEPGDGAGVEKGKETQKPWHLCEDNAEDVQWVW
jgi:hypothetical protein